jgi:hypothetical protein
MDDWLFIPSPGMMMDYLVGQWRKDQEGKPITLNSTLSAALNKCPAPWLNGICLRIGVDPRAQRKKPDRVKAVVAHLNDPQRLEPIVASLPDPSRQALAYVLDSGGWVRVGSLTGKFGTMDDVGWFWDEEEPPASPLGQLRVCGLLFVGKAGIKGRNYTVAVVPRDLRQSLQAIL